MQKALILTAGIAAGCLVTLALHIPWLRPLDSNTTNVAAAVSSSVLAVAGAYALWRHQVQQRQKDLAVIAVEMFLPVYEGLALVQNLVQRETAERLLDAQQGAGTSHANPVAYIVYQLEVLPDAIDAAKVAAEVSLQQWEGLNDILGGFDLKRLPRLLQLHHVANAAIESDCQH